MGIKAIDPSIWDGEPPVSTKEFFNNYYREPFYPIQQELVDAMLGTNPSVWDTTYNEFQAFWGKGSGKNHSSAKLVTYIAYWMLHLKDPQLLFFKTRPRDSSIALVNVSINSALARATFFEDLCRVVRNTVNPVTGRNWFVEHGMKLYRDLLRNEIRFPKDIFAYSLNSEEYTGEGLNILVVIFDEIGGFRVENAKNLYDALRETQVSRFPEMHKRALLSWKRSSNDYMSIRFNEGTKEKKTWQRKAKTWEVMVPLRKEDFADEYVRNPERARMTYECEGEISENTFFRYKYLIRKNVNKSHPHPLSNRASIVRSFRDVVFSPEFIPEVDGRYVVHIDLGTGTEGNDCLGFGMGHPMEMFTSYDPQMLEDLHIDPDNPGIVDRGIGVVVDLMLQMQAPAGKEVQFSQVIDFLLALRDHHGFNIVKVTYDSYMSRGEIQRLIENGFDAELYKIDANTEAYDTLKALLYSGLLDYYYNTVFIRECEELITIEPNIQSQSSSLRRGRVNHPVLSSRRVMEEGRSKGSKDVSDGVAGMCVQAIKIGASVEFALVRERPWDGASLIHPSEQERIIQEQLSERGRENVERQRRLLNAPLVRHGEVPPGF